MTFFVQKNNASIPSAIFEAGTPAAVVLTMCEAGALSVDDAWAPSTSTPVQPLILKWLATVTPRLAPSVQAPQEATWEQALSGQPTKDFAQAERVAAWAMQDVRAWNTPAPAYSHFNNGELLDTLLDMAVTHGWAWAGKAMLSQPTCPNLTEEKLNRLAVECLLMKHSSMLDVLLQHGLNPDVRFEPGQRTALHQANDADTVAVLLRHGANPMALDDDGRTCDEVWLGRSSDYSGIKTLEADKVKAMIAARKEALQHMPQAVREQADRRQDDFLFKNEAIDGFEAWLKTQPQDLTLGLSHALPSETLWTLTHSPVELGKRAGLLLRHESPQALLRDNSQGVKERESLWWLAVLANQKGLLPSIREGFPEALQPGAWLNHLDTLSLLLRAPEPVSRYGIVAQRRAPLGEACLNLLTTVLHKASPEWIHTCEVSAPADSNLRPHLLNMVADDWLAVDEQGRTPVARLLQAAADCWAATPGWDNLPSEASDGLRLLAEATRQSPMLANGQPDHALLAAATQLMACRHPGPRTTNLPVTDISVDADAVIQAWEDGLQGRVNRSINQINDAAFIPLLNIAGALVASGAQVPVAWVERMTHNPQLHHITPLFRAACLDATLDDTAGIVRRPRM